MKKLLIIISLTLIMYSCSGYDKTLIDKHDAHTKLPQSITKDFLDKQYLKNGRIYAEKIVWKYGYQEFRDKYKTSEKEDKLLGFWTPIIPDDDLTNTIEYAFLPNKVISVNFNKFGIFKGVWEINDQDIVITLLSFSDIKNLQEPKKFGPTKFVLGLITNISDSGYIEKPLNSIVSVLPIDELKNYQQQPSYRYLSIDIGGGMTSDFFEESLKRLKKYNFPSAEDIFAEKIPNARDFW